MRAHEVIIRLPPVQMSLHVGSLHGGGPRALCQSGHTVADRQIDTLNKRRVDAARKAQSL